MVLYMARAAAWGWSRLAHRDDPWPRAHAHWDRGERRWITTSS